MKRNMAARVVDGVDFVDSSENVLADLGIPNAGEEQTKIQLAVTLNRILQEKRLSQSAAAKRLGINQPKVSALKNYKLDGFSVERLMNFLTALSFDIEIVIKKKPRSSRPGKITISAA
jgi:predicted XRE-type DNA-binding protein